MIPYKYCNVNEPNIILLLSHTTVNVRRSVLHYFMNEQSKFFQNARPKEQNKKKLQIFFCASTPWVPLGFPLDSKITVTVTVGHERFKIFTCWRAGFKRGLNCCQYCLAHKYPQPSPVNNAKVGRIHLSSPLPGLSIKSFTFFPLEVLFGTSKKRPVRPLCSTCGPIVVARYCINGVRNNVNEDAIHLYSPLPCLSTPQRSKQKLYFPPQIGTSKNGL